MGFGVAGQCSRNRALAVDSLDPHDGRGGAQQVERARRKSCSRAESEFLCPSRVRAGPAKWAPLRAQTKERRFQRVRS